MALCAVLTLLGGGADRVLVLLAVLAHVAFVGPQITLADEQALQASGELTAERCLKRIR